MPEYDFARGRADGASSQHKIVLFERKKLGANNARQVHPASEGDDDDDDHDAAAESATKQLEIGQPTPKKLGHDDQNKELRNVEHRFREAHQNAIEFAAIEPGKGADEDSKKRLQQDRRQTDDQRNLPAVDGARQDVATDGVGAKWVHRRGRFEA
jgi:hypothetical protein